MTFTRRDTLHLGLAGLSGLALPTLLRPAGAAAQAAGDAYETDGGEIVVSPVSHASFVMTTPGGPVIYGDPVGGAALYAGHPAPDLILVTHEHGDHFDAETLAAIAAADTRLVVNPAVMDKLPAELKAKATAISNGESTEVGGIAIDAVPAYNTTPDRTQYHPKGRDNGYLLTIDGLRVYVAGDTEDIPEMRALTGIGVAFVPMNLPYTMDETQAAAAVAAFAPQVVYPYHYRGSDPKLFEAKLAEAAPQVKVVHGPWYPA